MLVIKVISLHHHTDFHLRTNYQIWRIWSFLFKSTMPGIFSLVKINNYLCFIAIAITFPAKSVISIFGPMEILVFFLQWKKYIFPTPVTFCFIVFLFRVSFMVPVSQHDQFLPPSHCPGCSKGFEIEGKVFCPPSSSNCLKNLLGMESGTWGRTLA